MMIRKNVKSILLPAVFAGLFLALTANAADTTKILIVPGHEETSPGAYFRGVKEADLNMEVGKYLFDLFKDDQKFEVVLARDGDSFNTTFQNYFTNEREEISEFMHTHEDAMSGLVAQGLVEVNQDVSHNRAPDETRLKLFGINKWVNEHDIDLVIHVHFNEYRNGTVSTEGKYSGFVIYVPEKQYTNAGATLPIAQSVYDRLNTFFATSDMPGESSGIVEDQDLIAIGASQTLDVPAMLIEYGYLYESQFIDSLIRPFALKELAMQTYLGVQKYFNTEYSPTHNTATLPYQWGHNVSLGTKHDKDVYALQIALTQEGVYPPENKNKNDCPVSGYFGNCTRLSVVLFQKKYNISPAYGFVGPLTRKKLNELYSNDI